MNDQIYSPGMEARERGDRLRRLRNLANLSRKSLCDQAEININTYIGYEVGRYGGLTKKGADKILQFLSDKGVYCSLDWLMYEVGNGPQVITEIGTEGKENPLILTEEQKIKDELVLFHKHYENAVDYKVLDDGMGPLFKVGDYIAGIPCFGDDIKNLLGSNCILQINKGDMIVRNLREGRNENTYTLTCSNPETSIGHPILYDVKLAFAATIIWHRKAHI